MLKKITPIIAALVILYVLLEITGRAYLLLTTGTSFLHPHKLIYHYYPQVVPIEKLEISNTDSTLDILVLSCSVLHKEWADINTALEKHIVLPQKYNGLHIYNASGIGHCSYDNLIKYQLLHNKHFDLIIYYDAINEARLNDCPPQIFKTDYSHYQWYDEINHILKHKEMDVTVVPFFADWLALKTGEVINRNKYEPIHYTLKPEWTQYGNNYKSLAVYKNNLNKIIQQAEEGGTQFYYVSFVYYLPADYSLQKFKNRSLDYAFCNNSRETEIWGQPKNVAGLIDNINDSSLNWVSTHKNATYIDIRNSFPKEGQYFADVCHFSPVGVDLFAIDVVHQLDSIMVTKNL